MSVWPLGDEGEGPVVRCIKPPAAGYSETLSYTTSYFKNTLSMRIDGDLVPIAVHAEQDWAADPWFSEHFQIVSNATSPIYHVMGTKEAARKWGISEETVKRYCRNGVVEAIQLDGGRPWIIARDHPKPEK